MPRRLLDPLTPQNQRWLSLVLVKQIPANRKAPGLRSMQINGRFAGCFTYLSFLIWAEVLRETQSLGS